MQKASTLTVSACRLTEIAQDEALAIGALIDSVWPRPDRGAVERAEQITGLGAAYQGPAQTAPVSFVVWEDDRVIAHALTFQRTIGSVEGNREVMALAMVATDSDQRGRGLGAAVVKAAFERVDSAAFDVALYQTSFGVRPFYEKLGACLVENRIVDSTNVDEPDVNPFWDDVVMRYPASAAWPEGEIDLNGPGY